MPDSLVNEFARRRKEGQAFGKSLKNAIFQAKPALLDDLEGGEKKKKFKLWKVNMRNVEDDQPVDWWFASTAIPILAATLGPLANVLSIGALVTFWRLDLRDPVNPSSFLPQWQGNMIPDPRWCYWINVASLVFGFFGNLFLLLNFTNRIRYIISLPTTILSWIMASSFLIGDLATMHSHARPISPYEIYSGGFCRIHPRTLSATFRFDRRSTHLNRSDILLLHLACRRSWRLRST